eukprot:Gregarina_sp_Poly_1__10135@NODE_692_length_6729_cov_121_134194_g522_i0_p2_GENE_NODE_692_length_6729_cov_121_134194_g522_i0NODE_692_length_6729_cov_121_134194_g522_i0_p2_ORF_typecomplete_len661_score68_31PRKCSH_1/PF13015_6/1PRKCSH_1/PF13015_6/2_2e08PRKCSH/PF07915_13/3_8PRKCSH/PF07915_13/2_7e08CIMR/PF00878_18/8_2CIMR/PF00878_18/0_079Man6P_recep/PF02157_15/1_6e02Man6P_recep/PF02157_15/0_1KAR9/PF08580_10/1_4_NODE_692_length_6729_cov_121_134194_g522_i020824064
MHIVHYLLQSQRVFSPSKRAMQRLRNSSTPPDQNEQCRITTPDKLATMGFPGSAQSITDPRFVNALASKLQAMQGRFPQRSQPPAPSSSGRPSAKSPTDAQANKSDSLPAQAPQSQAEQSWNTMVKDEAAESAHRRPPSLIQSSSPFCPPPMDSRTVSPFQGFSHQSDLESVWRLTPAAAQAFDSWTPSNNANMPQRWQPVSVETPTHHPGLRNGGRPEQTSSPRQEFMVWQSFLFSGSLALAALRTTHHELVNLLVPPTELKSVQVDYEVFVDEIEEPNSTYTNAIDISSGGVPYRCYSPPSLDGENEGPNVLSWITESALKLRDQARKQELTQSKTLSLLGNCFHLPGAESNWSFSICFGKEIVLYRGARLMANVGRDLFHLGFHEPSLDRVFLNGTIKQMYTEGTSNRSSSILMTCSDTIQDIEFMGTLGNHYEFKMSAPEFCDWRLRSDSRPHIDRLLAFDFGQCFNMTAEWWTYEYCHPDSLLQYHLESNGTVVTPMFLLGGLRIPDRQLESYRPIANPIFPFIRSSFPSIPGKLLAYAAEKVYKNLPVEIIDVPPRLLVSSQASGWAREIAPKGIALYMNEGSPCPEVPTGMRTTRVIFVCPPNMSDGRRRLRPLWVEEVRTCQYDLLVEVPAVCAHPLLRPAVEEFPKVVNRS